jgi:concentrative nucleoside transporter, CNT family
MFEKLIGFIGLIVFIGLCLLLSNDRKNIKWKPVLTGCFLQFVFAIFILKTPLGRIIFEKAKGFFAHLMGFGREGAAFVFGPLVKDELMGPVFGEANVFIFAIQVSAVIIFMASLFAILYHWGIMQRIVYVFAKIMQKVMGTSGSESLAAAANVFMGQTEAPLAVRPYLNKMTSSELMALMTGGMASVSGSILAAYVSFGIDAGHLLAASVMSAPACLAIAKIIIPEKEISETKDTVPQNKEKLDVNVLDAACRGATDGLKLSVNVMAMLIAFIALIALVNALLGWTTAYFFTTPITLEQVFGYLFSPFAFLLGVPWEDCTSIGSLLGVKTVLNEVVAYIKLGQIKDTLQPRSVILATYALCGFANFSSIAIQIGGIGALAPNRRKDLAKLGLKAMIGGTLAAFMTACIAGLLL